MLIPIFLNVAERNILIVGGGQVGLRKATTLYKAGGNPTVVSPQFCKEFAHLPIKQWQESFKPKHLEGMQLVFACTNDLALNRSILEQCRRQGILCQPTGISQEGDFLSCANFNWGEFNIAVGSKGTNVKGALDVCHQIQTILESQSE